MSLIDHLKLNDEDYNKNFVLLDVDETLIYRGQINTVLCNMLKENKDNSNFFLFTRMSIETIQVLGSFNNNTKKNTFRNFLRAKLKSEYQIYIKAVVTPFDVFDEMFTNETGTQKVHIPGDYYKDKIEQFEVLAYKNNNTQRGMTEKMETLVQKENEKDIQLKVDMFIQLVNYILTNKPKTITKKPTFIFFDDTVSQLFSVGLVGFSMSDKINLFIQNPLRKELDKQAEFIPIGMYNFSYNSKEYNNPFYFCNDINLTDADFLSKLVINVIDLLNDVNSNRIFLEKSDNDLRRILNYNKNGINLKSILFKLIEQILLINPKNLLGQYIDYLDDYINKIFGNLQEILTKEDLDIIKNNIKRLKEPPRTIATLIFSKTNGKINQGKVILTKINNDVIELKKNDCISFNYSNEENIIVKINDFYHSGEHITKISYSIWVTDDIYYTKSLIESYQFESIQLVECPTVSTINPPSLSLNLLTSEQIELLTQKQIWAYMNEIKKLSLEKIKKLIDNIKSKILQKILKEYYKKKLINNAKVQNNINTKIFSLTPDKIISLSQEQINLISVEHIKKFTNEQIVALKTIREKLSENQRKELNKEKKTKKKLTFKTELEIHKKTNPNSISGPTRKTKTQSNININTEEKNFYNKQINNYIKITDPIKVNSLTPEKIKEMDKDDIKDLTVNQLKLFTYNQASAFTNEQKKLFKEKQLDIINSKLIEIPKPVVPIKPTVVPTVVVPTAIVVPTVVVPIATVVPTVVVPTAIVVPVKPTVVVPTVVVPVKPTVLPVKPVALKKLPKMVIKSTVKKMPDNKTHGSKLTSTYIVSILDNNNNNIMVGGTKKIN